MFLKVGFTTMSSEEGLKAGLRGKALRIAHYYRDFLWYVLEMMLFYFSVCLFSVGTQPFTW